MRNAKDDLTTTLQVRLHPTPEQSRWLMTHCQEYISTINALVAAQELEILPGKASTKDFQASLPSAVKNQALRDAQSVYKKSFDLGVIPKLKKPICCWNNQNWQITDGTLALPMCVDGKTQQHDTQKSWGNRPQKQPHEEYMVFLSVHPVHHLQSNTHRDRRRASRSCLHITRMPCLWLPQ